MMSRRVRARTWMALAAAGLAVSVAVRAAEQAPAPFPGLLDEHPAIQYGLRPTTDRGGPAERGARAPAPAR